MGQVKKVLPEYREQILRATNHDEQAERELRAIVRMVAAEAPLHSLITLSNFIADVIYREADIDAALEN